MTRKFPMALVIAAISLAGCSDNREVDADACQLEALRHNVTDKVSYVRLCMSGKGYEFRMDELCSLSYNNGLALWACFQKRPTIPLGKLFNSK